jgi:hypothetical protein
MKKFFLFTLLCILTFSTAVLAGDPPAAFFGVSATASLPLGGGIVPGTLGKNGGIIGHWLEATCDGGTNPSNSCYTWSGLDSWVNEATANNLNMVYEFGIPGWQCGQASTADCTILPTNLTYLTNFATALATRYYGKIHYYETGNEVNNAPNWTDTCSNLVLAHNTIYAAIKAVDATAIVGAPNMAAYNGTSGGGGACVSSPNAAGNVASIWLSNFLATEDSNGHYPTVDTVGVHTYANGISTSLDGCNITTYALGCAGAPLLHLYNSFRSVMTTAGLTSVPLLITEGGFGEVSQTAASPYGCSTNSYDGTACLSPAQQVAYVGRWLVLGASTWADGDGQLASWYGYDFNWGTLNGTYGMNSQNASAYGQMESWVTGASFSEQCHTGTPLTVFVCDFTNAGQQYEIVFNDNNGSTASYTTPSWATIYQPLMGSVNTISGGSVTVGDTPIILRQNSGSVVGPCPHGGRIGAECWTWVVR